MGRCTGCHDITENRINSLPNDKILDWSKIKAFAEDKVNLTQKLKFALGRVENCGEWRKSWLPAFSPYPTMFSNGYFLWSLKVLFVWLTVN